MTKHYAKRTPAWLLVVATGLATAGPGFAEATAEVMLTVKPPDKNNPKTKDDAPQVEATVIGAPNLPLDKFSLREDGSKQPVELKPTQKRDFTQGTEKLAIA